jgi:hypothetical protein
MHSSLLALLCAIIFPSFLSAQSESLAVNASYGTNTEKSANNEAAASSGGSASSTASIKHIGLSEVTSNIGQTVTVCGQVYDARLLKNIAGKPTLMNLGGDYANERVEIRIRFAQLANFDYNPEKIFLHKNVCIIGTITNEHGFAEIAIDTFNASRLIREAMNEEADTVKHNTRGKLKLVTNAYLLAGSSLKEPIITHLKQGSVVIPEYSTHGWTYAKVVEKKDAAEQPVWMYGFIRNQALGLTKRGRLPSEQKKFLGLKLYL